MSDSKFKSRYHGVDRRAAGAVTADADGADAFGAPLKRGTKIGGRHAAITTDLYSWHSYKNWADKMRGSWGEKK
ncbi:MAG TPA: hypothetical protein VND80_11595 [Steroidobacteraceae bacterium]|nr:hypothetical protein [Steroidobacteraceae bacterium]